VSAFSIIIICTQNVNVSSQNSTSRLCGTSRGHTIHTIRESKVEASHNVTIQVAHILQ